jgi:hypothetical protein
MDEDDVYRRRAAEAQSWAQKVLSDDDRASWRRIADGWLSLTRKRPQADQPQAQQQQQPQPKTEDKPE